MINIISKEIPIEKDLQKKIEFIVKIYQQVFC